MWPRFKRAVRSFFGFFVSSVENPELILEQNIRDLNDQVPKMNENIAMVRANQTLLEKDNQKLKSEVAELTAKVKAGIQAGRDDLAAGYATQLQNKREYLARNEAELEVAKQAYEKALNLKKVFMKEKEKKTREAMQAIRDHRRAQWQSKVADAMETFQVAGIDQTHDEMIRKVEEKTALNEARMQMALDSVDHQAVSIEEEAEKIRAAELVKQFKLEMGMTDAPKEPVVATPEPVSDGEKSIGKKVEIK